MNKDLKKNIQIISAHIEELQDNFNVKKIGIFGSVAKGKQKRNSDIDIVVELYEPIGFFQFIELEEYLSSLLKRKVDLATKKALKPAIKQDVLKETVYV